MLVGIFISCTVGVGYFQWHQRQITNESNVLVQRARNLLAKNDETSFQLARKAFFTAPHNPLTLQILLKTYYQIKGHNTPGPDWPRLSRMSFSPDESLVVVPDWKNSAIVYNKYGHSQAVLKGHQDKVLSATFSPEGNRILTVSQDHTAGIWDLNGQRLHLLTGHKGPVIAGTYSADGQLIVTGSVDKTGRLWDRDGKLLTVLTGHQQQLNVVVFTPISNKVITGGNDGTVRVWRIDGSSENVFKVMFIICYFRRGGRRRGAHSGRLPGWNHHIFENGCHVNSNV